MSNYKTYKDLPSAEKKVETSPSSSPNSILTVIESADQKQHLIMNNRVVIIDIYGDFCGPCKSIAPKFEKMAQENSNTGIIFAKEDAMKKISPYVKGVPTFEYYVDSKLYGNTVGADHVEIKNKLEEIKKIISTSQQQPNQQQHSNQQPNNQQQFNQQQFNQQHSNQQHSNQQQPNQQTLPYQTPAYQQQNPHIRNNIMKPM